MRKDQENHKQRQSTFHVMMLVALAITAGRIATVSSKEGDTAFLSANDRSRWCTVAALVEHGTYVIDEQIKITGKKMTNRRPWATIDKVRHVGRDGTQHYYSSKPPLFPTLVAVVYKLVNLLSGMTLTDQPIYVARLILALVNLPLLAIFYWATIDSITRVCRSESAQTGRGAEHLLWDHAVAVRDLVEQSPAGSRGNRGHNVALFFCGREARRWGQRRSGIGWLWDLVCRRCRRRLRRRQRIARAFHDGLLVPAVCHS